MESRQRNWCNPFSQCFPFLQPVCPELPNFLNVGQSLGCLSWQPRPAIPNWHSGMFGPDWNNLQTGRSSPAFCLSSMFAGTFSPVAAAGGCPAGCLLSLLLPSAGSVVAVVAVATPSTPTAGSSGSSSRVRLSCVLAMTGVLAMAGVLVGVGTSAATGLAGGGLLLPAFRLPTSALVHWWIGAQSLQIQTNLPVRTVCSWSSFPMCSCRQPGW